jgi:GAF domain-containing protein
MLLSKTRSAAARPEHHRMTTALVDRPEATDLVLLPPLAQTLLALLVAPDETALAASIAEHVAVLQQPGEAGRQLVEGLAIAQRRHREASLRGLQQRILALAHSAGSIEVFYGAVHGVIGASMACPDLHVALLSDDDDWLHFPYVSAQGQGSAPAARPVGCGLVEYVLRIGRPLLVDRTDPAKSAQVQALQACGEIQPLPENLVAWLGVPLVSSDRTLGVLAVQSTTTAVVFDACDQELLSAVSWQIADGIKQQQRSTAQRQTVARLEARVSELEAELGMRKR